MSGAPSPLPTLGALRLWREEAGRGLRTAVTFDALWRAAAWEAAARDLQQQGAQDSARRALERAAAAVNEAVATRRSAA